MRKKIICIFCIFSFIIKAEIIDERFKEPIIYVLTDYGLEIEKENIDLVHPIASLTKVMNVMVALDEIENNRGFSFKDKVLFDKDTAYISGGLLSTSAGDNKYYLEDLLMMELIFSSNNSAYAVAKHIGKGDISKYVELMNKKARKIGMKDTIFSSPAGLPPRLNKGYGMDISTARDLAKMTLETFKYDKIYKFTKLKSISFPYSIDPSRKYYSKNKILGKYGVIGLKTGFHSESYFNDIIVSEMGLSKLIIITLNIESDRLRNILNLNILRDLYSKQKILFKKGKDFKLEVDSSKYLKKEILVELKEDIYSFNFEKVNYEIKNIYDSDKEIKKDDIVAEMNIYSNNKFVKKVKLFSNENNRKLTFLEKILRKFNLK